MTGDVVYAKTFYPYSFVLTLEGNLDPSPEHVEYLESIVNLRKNIDDALDYINADELTWQYHELRNKKKHLMEDVAKQMGVTLNRCRGIGIQLTRNITRATPMWIIYHGIENLEQRYTKWGAKEDIPIEYLDELVTTRVSSVIHRGRIIPRPDGKADWAHNLGDIAWLIKSGQIYHMNSLGRKSITDSLIPGMKTLGFSDEELGIKEE